VELSWGRALPRPFDVPHVVIQPGEDPQAVPHEVYDNLYRKFDPAQFDATTWVEAARDLGAGYVVLTAKHHDGFCLWDSALTDYKITSPDSPFGRDIVREFADACHASGMRLGIYYSQRDWHHPDYLQGDNHLYQQYMDGQLRELLTNYGEVDVLWFDSYGESELSDWDPASTLELARQLQPGILINNRLAVLARFNEWPEEFWGDFDTPEQEIGDLQLDRPWESCVTLAPIQWGWHPSADLLSRAECIRALVTCATRGGNLLLNVGPDPSGLIEARQRARLAELGSWLAQFGESIRGTSGVAVSDGVWGGITRSEDSLYVHVLDWQGDDGVDVPIALRTAAPLEVLTGGTAVTEPLATGSRIVVRSEDPRPIDTIIRIRRTDVIDPFLGSSS